MSGQTRTVSLIEATLSTMAGYVISFFVWHFAGPLFGYVVTFWDNFWITNIFTVVSIARQYVFRRFFNAELHVAAVRWARWLADHTHVWRWVVDKLN